MFTEDIASVERAGLWGIPVSSSKVPCIPWRQYQTTPPTRDDIERWCRQFPLARVGLILFLIIVLDCDSTQAIRYAQRKGMPRNTWACSTRRGTHFYFATP